MTTENKPADEFEKMLTSALELARKFPDYSFELINHYMHALKSNAMTIENLLEQFKALPEERQLAGLQIFDSAILRAKQVNYRPLNDLDAFIERQLYGIQDEKVVEKGVIGKMVKSLEESQTKPPPPPPKTRAKQTGPIPARPLPPPPQSNH